MSENYRNLSEIEHVIYLHDGIYGIFLNKFKLMFISILASELVLKIRTFRRSRGLLLFCLRLDVLVLCSFANMEIPNLFVLSRETLT